MKTAEQRMKELQKLIENGENYLQYKPIHAELKKLKNGWTNKRDKYEEAHRAELTLWLSLIHIYHGLQDIPKEHKVFSFPKLSIREQMAAYQEIIDGSSLEGYRQMQKKDRGDR